MLFYKRMNIEQRIKILKSFGFVVDMDEKPEQLPGYRFIRLSKPEKVIDRNSFEEGKKIIRKEITVYDDPEYFEEYTHLELNEKR